MGHFYIGGDKKGETSVWRTEKMRDSKSGIQHGFVIEDRTFETDSYEIITKGVLVPLPDDYISETEPPSETKSKPQGRNYSLLCPFITKSLREAGNIDSEDVIVNRCIGLMLEMDSKGTAKRKTSDLRTRIKEVLAAMEGNELIYRNEGMVSLLETH